VTPGYGVAEDDGHGTVVDTSPMTVSQISLWVHAVKVSPAVRRRAAKQHVPEGGG